ncbi:MAG: adenosylcobinamide-GDP ribazoletransferase [Actinomycetota bacterium]|nr:adenosylcobinamide-GDP ribazoletransferase [Actinomycetota bacterium]
MRAALAFLTCLGGPVPPTPRALPWFPVVGAGLGLVLGATWWVAEALWPPLLAATLVVAADLAVTGMLHLDGLADSADGLLAHGLEPSRRLEVMAEPSVGAFALGTVVLVLGMRIATLSALRPSPGMLAALWATSRAAMALAVHTQPYARDRGLATSFRGGTPAAARTVIGLVAVLAVIASVTVVTSGAADLGPVILAVAVAVLAAAGVVGLARRRVGGYTGDVLGAAGMVAETAGLVVAATRW